MEQKASPVPVAVDNYYMFYEYQKNAMRCLRFVYWASRYRRTGISMAQTADAAIG